MTRARDLADSADKDISGTLVLDDITLSNDISIADNGKAIFGAGSDLQIYHDGSHSYIRENGTGDLTVSGDNLYLEKGNGTKFLYGVSSTGQVRLYYGDAQKFTTTSTGIDVTGTVTADGLTVDGDGTLQSGTGAILKIRSTDTSVTTGDIAGQIYFETDDASRTVKTRNAITSELLGSAANTRLKFKSSQDDGALTTRMDIDSNGDISFYDSAGSSQSFFWDASAERLGINSTTPTSPLTVNGQADFQASGTTVLSIEGGATNAIIGAKNSRKLKLQTATTTRLNIDDNGDLSLYDSTGTTPKFFWDASAETLDIGGGNSNAVLDVLGSSLNDWALRAENTEGTGQGWGALIVASANTSAEKAFEVRKNTSDTAMLIDGVGNVGIGTDSPQTLLHLTDHSNGAKLRLQGNGGNAADTLLGSVEYFNNDGSNDTPAIVSSINSYSSSANGTGGYLTFSTHDGTEGGEGSSAVERMRLDASGNLLVGTTTVLAAESNVEGISLAAGSYGGLLSVSRDGNRAATFNRKTSDGDIVEFRKDGSTVGSIGTNGGKPFIVDSFGVGVSVNRYNGESSLMPAASSAATDAAGYLGGPSNRWKDLYLSGGVYLGGTQFTSRRYESGGGSGIFATLVSGKAQMGELFAYDTATSNWCHYSLKKNDQNASVSVQQISGSGLTVAATNAVGTVTLSITASTVKMVVTIWVVEN